MCSFTIETEAFTTFTAEIVAHLAVFDDWSNQPDSSHWRDHMGVFEDGQNYYSLRITTVDPCLDSNFPITPLISG